LLQLKETSAHLHIQRMDSRLQLQLLLPWLKVGQEVMSSERWLTSCGTLLQLKSFTRYVWNSDCSKSCDCAFCIVMAHHVKLTRSCIQKNYSVQCTLNVMLSYYDKPHEGLEGWKVHVCNGKHITQLPAWRVSWVISRPQWLREEEISFLVCLQFLPVMWDKLLLWLEGYHSTHYVNMIALFSLPWQIFSSLGTFLRIVTFTKNSKFSGKVLCTKFCFYRGETTLTPYSHTTWFSATNSTV